MAHTTLGDTSVLVLFAHVHEKFVETLLDEISFSAVEAVGAPIIFWDHEGKHRNDVFVNVKTPVPCINSYPCSIKGTLNNAAARCGTSSVPELQMETYVRIPYTMHVSKAELSNFRMAA